MNFTEIVNEILNEQSDRIPAEFERQNQLDFEGMVSAQRQEENFQEKL